jgi:hypothetical protein
MNFFGITLDWADGVAYDRFFGFEKRLEDNLGFQTTEKGLKLFVQTKSNIKMKSELPPWVGQVIEKIKILNNPLLSVLKKPVEAISPSI